MPARQGTHASNSVSRPSPAGSPPPAVPFVANAGADAAAQFGGARRTNGSGLDDARGALTEVPNLRREDASLGAGGRCRAESFRAPREDTGCEYKEYRGRRRSAAEGACPSWRLAGVQEHGFRF